jgi:hypothetical protein
MVDPAPPGPRDAPDGAPRVRGGERRSERVSQGPRSALGGLAAKARAHKVAATAIAVAGFLGLGSIFGQWAVDRIVDLIEGDSPPRGFNELHDAWEDTADLSDQLRATGMEVNETLVEGAADIGEWTSPELVDDQIALRGFQREANELLGRVRSTTADLQGARADLARLVALVGTTAEHVKVGTSSAFSQYRGEPIELDPGDATPIFSDALRDDVYRQNDLVTRVSAALGPTAERFDRSTPEIRGWLRLITHKPSSDDPLL